MTDLDTQLFKSRLQNILSRGKPSGNRTVNAQVIKQALHVVEDNERMKRQIDEIIKFAKYWSDKPEIDDYVVKL